MHTPDGVVESMSTITPHMTLERLIACPQATDGLSQHARFPNTHEEMSLDEVAFEMITDDFNKTLEQLDSIRARKSKFVCVNDDMRDPSPELVQALEDFYVSFFPHPSQFELPAGVASAAALPPCFAPVTPPVVVTQAQATRTCTWSPCKKSWHGGDWCGTRSGQLRRWRLSQWRRYWWQEPARHGA